MKPHRRKSTAGEGVWVREDRLPTPAELAWLASDEGRAICREMDLHSPADTPAHIARWRERLEPDRVAAAWAQVLLRRRGRVKFSRADEMLFDRVGMEQATDEVVAAHKARRFAGLQRVADLCCGIGGDAIALAAGSTVTAVDWSPLRTAMAEHNARVYGRSITTITEDVAFCLTKTDLLALAVLREVEAVHIDPDRRTQFSTRGMGFQPMQHGQNARATSGPRRHEPETASPDLPTLRQMVAHYVHAAVKLAPGADFEALGFEAEIEVISHAGECKQAVAWTGRFAQTFRRATALPSGESIAADAAENLAWPPPGVVGPGRWLFEPDAAVVRAHLVGVLARRHGLAPVDPLIAYLVGDEPVASGLLTPFRVLDTADFSTAAVRRLLIRRAAGPIEVKTRGFAARPDDLRRLVQPRGSRPATLFLTRLAGRPRAILAERPTNPGRQHVPGA